VAIDYRRLRAVVYVADELSFSRAAERLNISQPGLSAQVRSLEAELEFDLFDRSTRRVELTDLGRLFLPEARRLVIESERLERFVRFMRRQESTQLSVGTAIYTIDFPDRIRLLERIIEACPDLRVQINTGITQTAIAAELAAGHVDLAILMGLPVPSETYQRAVAANAGRESLLDQGLRSVLLRRKPVELLVPAELPLARRRHISKRDLAGQRVAVFNAYHGQQLYQPIVDYLVSAGAEPVVPPESNAIGVERHGRKVRVPAFTLGWFPQPAHDPTMVRRGFADLRAETHLVLAGHPEHARPAVERAFAVADQLVEDDAQTRDER
jgi:DNA-binding transcriptional LysR family regulator